VVNLPPTSPACETSLEKLKIEGEINHRGRERHSGREREAGDLSVDAENRSISGVDEGSKLHGQAHVYLF